jgi:DnaJ family protein C protein 2
MVNNLKVLRICYSEELIDGQPIHVSSNSLPFKESKFEPAGHSFHSAALKLRGCIKEEGSETDENETKDLPNEKDQSYSQSSESYSTKGKKKSGAAGEQDHYALLGLGHLRYLATEDQIKKSYRETALKYHPDKQASLLLAELTESAKETKKDEIENHFKNIQEAYEVLTDPARRRIYDSTDEFDDEIPTDCAPQDFFKVFGPAFLRNGRWSVTQPIPNFGDENTPLKEVDNFYNFWYAFRSWREFPHDEEFDLEQAESRDHKRWMERQNAKLSEKARKEEYARVRSLVDNAYKRDPRILKRKEVEKAEKQKRKEAKYMVKKVQEEEAKKAAEEERKKKEEEEKKAAEFASAQKKVKEKEKKLLRKERNRLRALSAMIISSRLLDIVDDDVENLCMSLDMEPLKSLCDKMEGKSEESEKAEILKEMIKEEEKNQDGKPKLNLNLNVNNNQPKKVNGNVAGSSYSNQKKEKPWAKEEIELLRKGTQKYPKGTSRRWEVISEYIGTNRSVEEILKATKTVLLQKPDSSKAFDSFLEKRKTAPVIASPLSTRDDIDPVIPASATVNNGVTDKSDKESSSQSQSTSPVKDDVVANGDQDAWSAIQERALVQALKTFPKETSQRWERVATAVPGKTMNQCKKKFTSLKENFRSKKSAV